MGYESRIYIGERFKSKGKSGKEYVSFIEDIRLDMGKMWDDKLSREQQFWNIFKTPADFTVEAEWNRTDENEGYTDIDAYGDHITYCHADDIIEWHEKAGYKMDYWKEEMLYNIAFLMEKYKPYDFAAEMVFVHFGF